MLRLPTFINVEPAINQLTGRHGVLIGAVCGLIFLSACNPKEEAHAPVSASVAQASAPHAEASPDANAPVSRAKPTQVAKTPATPAASTQSEAVSAGKAITIAGGWVNAGGACDSGASVFFNSDGTYMSEGENGTWALSGKTLTVTTTTSIDEADPLSQGPDESTGDSGEKAVLTLLSLTDDTARVVLSNGSNANWTRCTS